MDNKLKVIITEAQFYAPFPDALGRVVRNFIIEAGGTPNLRDTNRESFNRSQDPVRLANWANSLEPYEEDLDLGNSVKQIYAVVDTILLKN